MSRFENVYTYKDVVVGLDADYRFIFEGCERGGYRSAEECNAAIDARLKREANVAKRRLDLPVIDSEGISHVITGVHAKNGNLLLSPPVSSYKMPELYPTLPGTVEKATEYALHMANARRIAQELRPLSIAWADYRDGKCDDPLARIELIYKTVVERANGNLKATLATL